MVSGCMQTGFIVLIMLVSLAFTGSTQMIIPPSPSPLPLSQALTTCYLGYHSADPSRATWQFLPLVRSTTDQMLVDSSQSVNTAHPRLSILSPTSAAYIVASNDGATPILTLYQHTNDTNPIRLNPTGYSAVRAVWSPDGKKIAIIAFANDYRLYVMNSDGTSPLYLSEGIAIADMTPSWSFDGKMIAVGGGSDDQKALWLVDADGKNAPRQMALPLSPIYTWSPNGMYITAEFERSQIHILNLTTNQVAKISGENLQRFGVIWSSDSQWLAFIEGGQIEGNQRIPGQAGQGGNPPSEGQASAQASYYLVKIHPDLSARTSFTPSDLNVSAAAWSPITDQVVAVANDELYMVSHVANDAQLQWSKLLPDQKVQRDPLQWFCNRPV